MLTNTLSHFFKAPRSTSNRLAKRMNREYRPMLESLERRDAPAGVVTTLQTGTTLRISGVDDTTKAGILAGVNHQAITVVGGLAGDVSITGDLGTVINGKTSFSGITNIRFNMSIVRLPRMLPAGFRFAAESGHWESLSRRQR